MIFLLYAGIGTLCTGCKSKSSHSESSHDHEHVSSDNNAQKASSQPLSLPSETHGNIGKLHISIQYTAPAVRGRIIWGGLVPYDNIWVTGAHNATQVTFNNTVMIGGQSIDKGKYAFFTIPGTDEWTIILNKNWNQHQADDYNTDEDVVRVKVKSDIVDNMQERLQYTIEDIDGTNGNITVHWEKLKVSLPLQVL
ncbi:MAG TPA: DUF2911 domain-containing protein [Saprospiraceae bacterium]|nr:DUF2911 domain-containing protein [Saprospiraceae bacterium]